MNVWIWHTRGLIASAAWRRRPINCVRLLEYLEIEHLANAALDNGRLLATYDRLQEFGLSRRFIWDAVKYAEHMGLIEVSRGGKKGQVKDELSRFRLTYAWHRTRENDLWTWHLPTDDWSAKTEADVADVEAIIQRHHRELEAKKIGAQRCTSTVHKGEPPSVHKGELQNGQALEIAQGDQVHKGEHTSISGGYNGHKPKRPRSAPEGSAEASGRASSTSQNSSTPRQRRPERKAAP